MDRWLRPGSAGVGGRGGSEEVVAGGDEVGTKISVDIVFLYLLTLELSKHGSVDS